MLEQKIKTMWTVGPKGEEQNEMLGQSWKIETKSIQIGETIKDKMKIKSFMFLFL